MIGFYPVSSQKDEDILWYENVVFDCELEGYEFNDPGLLEKSLKTTTNKYKIKMIESLLKSIVKD